MEFQTLMYELSQLSTFLNMDFLNKLSNKKCMIVTNQLYGIFEPNKETIKNQLVYRLQSDRRENC